MRWPSLQAHGLDPSIPTKEENKKMFFPYLFNPTNHILDPNAEKGVTITGWLSEYMQRPAGVGEHDNGPWTLGSSIKI